MLKAIFISAVALGTALPAARDDVDYAHVVERLSFGARPADIERARAIGLERYIDEQLDPSRVNDDDAMRARLARFETLDLSSSEMVARFYSRPPKDADATQRDPQMRRQAGLPLLELSQQKILRATYSDRQLEEVLVDFWFNHFNVFSGKGQFARFYLTEYEREAIRPHVLGRFRDMLGATAESPAMLWYLDNWMSAAPSGGAATPEKRARMRRPARMPAPARPQRPARGLNENYGRELLELHTLGVDGGYSQEDVVNVARAFTGWTIDAPRQGGGGFTFNARIHDRGEKVVLGQRIPAGGGREDGERVLDIVAAHPATARHIAQKLATRFVSDTPPAALVDRAAQVFRDTKGDLRAVTRAIVTSPEFLAPVARRAKVKTPFEFVVSALRVTGADVVNAAPLVQQLRTLGMPLYGAQPPTGYGDAAASWINSGALLARMNFAVALSENQIPGSRVRTDDAKALALRLGSVEFQRREP